MSWSATFMILSIGFIFIGIALYFATWKLFDDGKYKAVSELRNLSILFFISSWGSLLFSYIFYYFKK